MCQQGALSAVETPGATHVHTLILSALGIDMGTATYETGASGTAPHTHSVTLTPAELATLRAGGAITTMTEMDATGHTHTYEIECMP